MGIKILLLILPDFVTSSLMLGSSQLLVSLFLSAQFLSAQFQVTGEIICPPGTAFREAQIESIDHKIIKHTGINKKNKFSFSVPEGLYKITVTAESGQSEQRTIEVRQAFANDYYEIPVKIEMLDVRAPAKTVKSSPAPDGSDAPDSPGNKAAKAASKLAADVQRANGAKNTKKARDILEKALEIDPQSADVLNGLGSTYSRDKDFRKAAELFQKALNVKPDFYPARINLGAALLAMGEYDRALEENSKAVEMQANDSVAQSQLGQSFFHLKRYDDAMQHLELARHLDPMSDTLPGLYIAQIHEARGENSAALAEYKDLLKIHPGHEYVGAIQNEIMFLEKQTAK
jgi:tetratricopeptide (TPR) repeat protein